MKRSCHNAVMKNLIEMSSDYDCFSIKKDDEDEEQDTESYFSHHGCDACNISDNESGGAGDVYDITFLDKKDIKNKKFDNPHEGAICHGCLCFLVNGDIEDYSVTDEDEEILDYGDYGDMLYNSNKGLSDILLSLIHHQDYTISVNGEGVEQSVDDLMDRFLSLADEDDKKTIAAFVVAGDIAGVMSFLAHNVFDFDFNREA